MKLLKTIKTNLILFSTCYLCLANPVYADETTLNPDIDKYNIFKLSSFDGKTAQESILLIAKFMYNAIFLIGMMFLGYRIMKSLYVYFTADVFVTNKKQLINELKEPFWGIIFFIAGWIVIKVLANFVFGIDIGDR